MIYFFRHGLDDEDYLGGWSDVSLTLEGKKQVEIAGFKMTNYSFKKIITSDVLRAKETAEILASILSIEDFTHDSIFNEQNKGLLNGMKKDIAYIKYPEYKENVTVDMIYPEGESLRDLYNRIKNNLDKILSLEDNTLIVTHRGVINMLYYILNDIELDMDKKRFNVTHASLHELDTKKLTIRRVL